MVEDTAKIISINTEDIHDAEPVGFQSRLIAGDLIFPACRDKIEDLPLQQQQSELEVRTGFVKVCMKNISANFLRIGRMLARIRKDFDFTTSEYLTFYAYCACRFDLGKTTVVNLIKVYELFSERIVKEEKYSRYSYSQLAEMVPLAGLPIEEKITPAFTVTQIRALKQEIKRKLKGTESTETRKNRKQRPNTVYKFEDIVSARKFLTGYEAWEMIGEVQAIGVTFFRCYLSIGIQIVAEQIGFGDEAETYYHRVNEKGMYERKAFTLQQTAEMLMQLKTNARLIPFELEDIVQAQMTTAAQARRTQVL